jgi:hypothetical protein
MALDFGRELCGDLNTAERREWLVTNGIGGFASGTIAGLLTRRYHGLLVAALKPPLGRTLLVAKIDETAEYDGIYPQSGRFYPLHVNRWGSGLVEPDGHHHLNRFHLEGTTPVWTYAFANALLEKRIWMQPGANTTYIQYKLTRATGPLGWKPNCSPTTATTTKQPSSTIGSRKLSRSPTGCGCKSTMRQVPLFTFLRREPADAPV